MPKEIEMHENDNLNMESDDILLNKEQALFLLEEVVAKNRQTDTKQEEDFKDQQKNCLALPVCNPRIEKAKQSHGI